MIGLWTGFVLFVLFLLWLDLAVLNKGAHVIEPREAVRWTSLWVALSFAFSVFLYFVYTKHWFDMNLGEQQLPGGVAWQQFTMGYIVELSLSFDNVFVMALIFQYFRVPRENQHRTLFWGIVGAMVFRGVMIGAGSALVSRFEWMIAVFGVILLLTAIKMLFTGDEQVDPDSNPLVRAARRLYPVTSTYEGERFFTLLPDGRRAMTPLFLVLLVIESTDILFAVDSIPAIFGITRDPFIVFTSNVFAILGLRSLYFLLAGMIARFPYLKPSLIFVLLFIAVKMLLPHHLKEMLPDWAALLVIFGILFVGIVASLVKTRGQAVPVDDDPMLPPVSEFDNIEEPEDARPKIGPPHAAAEAAKESSADPS
ncbi:MAG: TerC family protein [Fimbriimonadaceae bacterium]|nr:TerC family protein [Fimbriimonadaceae bacterium]